MQTLSYTLKEISEFDLHNTKSQLVLPQIQRGLVWKAHQIELLWDSILCQYPIGSVMVVKTSHGNDLFDGQQRINAIMTGFDRAPLFADSSPESILWLDLGFDSKQSLNRRYGFRLTTKAHPWGYNIEEQSVLNTEQRRAAIRQAGLEGTKKREWDIRTFIPYSSKMAVPFAIITNALYHDCDIEEFIERVISDCRAFQAKAKGWNFDEQAIQAKCVELFDTLSYIRKYRVIAHYIEPKDDDKRYLELFFNRINTGGTKISDEELAYSAIKLYWAGLDIAEVNRNLARNYMPEAKFAQLVFRCFCSEANSIRGSIDATYIRRLSECGDRLIIEAINSAYSDNGNELRQMQNIIDSWLLYDNIPSFVRTEIAHNAPTLYVLLLFLARLQYTGRLKATKEYMLALALYLYCFCNNDERPIQYIYRQSNIHLSSDKSIDEPFISSLLRDSVCFGWAALPHHDVAKFKAFESSQFSAQWDIWSYINEPYGASVCRMFGYNNNFRQLTMLKVVEREAFARLFEDYDPARQDLWERSNRPWDDDHIVPKSWIPYNTGQFQELCKRWVWSMGNIAHIPFEENRAKGNRSNWEFYTKDDNARMLHFDRRIESITTNFVVDEAMARHFIEVTTKRFCNIFQAFVAFLTPLCLTDALSAIQQRRKSALEQLQSRGYLLFYVAGEADIEFDSHDNYGWMQQWVGAKKQTDRGTAKAVVIGLPLSRIDHNWCHINIGIRKPSTTKLADTQNGSWWDNERVKRTQLPFEQLEADVVNQLIAENQYFKMEIQ